MARPALNPASQPWGRAVDASVAGVRGALVGAQQAAGAADGSLQTSITRTTTILQDTASVADYLITLAVVKSESRTNAIGV